MKAEVVPHSQSTILKAGLAMFSMYFGAGNIVFPLVLGQLAEGNTFYAILGLLITAVGVPFLGLIAMTLFNGNYRHFFDRLGYWPSTLFILFMMIMIGPIGAIPRLIALSHATVNIYWPGTSLILFSALSCLIIFLTTYKKNRVVDILSYYFTPLLLLSLGLIAYMGFINMPMPTTSNLEPSSAFLLGFMRGYETMDLLGSFIFSSIVLSCLEYPNYPVDHPHAKKNFRNMIFITLKASVIGALLLGSVYVSFCYAAAHNSVALHGLSSDQLLGQLALLTLGPYAGIIAIIAVTFACITTAIALSVVFAEYIHHEVLKGKSSYTACLITTLIVAFFMSTLSFTGIMAILAPILQVLYPALIVLSILNILHKVWHINSVKIPFWITLALSFILTR